MTKPQGLPTRRWIFKESRASSFANAWSTPPVTEALSDFDEYVSTEEVQALLREESCDAFQQGEKYGELKQLLAVAEFKVSVPDEHHAIKAMYRELIPKIKAEMADIEAARAPVVQRERNGEGDT